MVLGLDGLGEESLKAFGMPRLANLLEKGMTTNPSVDNVVSRGWPEIYSGEVASTTGAYFQIPVLSNGSIIPSQKTGVEVVTNHVGEDALLWTKLQSAGYSIGVFGLPTVGLPLENIAFSFPATGAGLFGASMAGAAVWPSGAERFSDYTSNTLGFRVGRGGYLPRSAKQLEQWIRDHMAQYFATLRLFLSTSKPDAVIVASRFLTLFYKFQHVFARDASQENQHVARMLQSVGHDFDTLLMNFIESEGVQHLFVVSDHGVGALEYHVNINELLRQSGLIQYRGAPRRLARWLYLSTIGRVSRGRHLSPIFPTFDLDQSKAFSIGYTDCIYINDARFTGPPMSVDERYDLACDIAAQLTEDCARHDLNQFLQFEPIRNEGMTNPRTGEKDRIPLPDIRCHLSEGSVNLEQTNGRVVEKHHPSRAGEMFRKGFEAQHSGVKSRDTLASYIGPNPELVKMEKLTDIYHSIVRVSQLR